MVKTNPWSEQWLPGRCIFLPSDTAWLAVSSELSWFVAGFSFILKSEPRLESSHLALSWGIHCLQIGKDTVKCKENLTHNSRLVTSYTFAVLHEDWQSSFSLIHNLSKYISLKQKSLMWQRTRWCMPLRTTAPSWSVFLALRKLPLPGSSNVTTARKR